MNEGSNDARTMTTLACDMGGRRIKLGLVREKTVIASEVMPAQADRPLGERLDSVAEALSRLCAGAGIRLEDCTGIGVSFPSIIDTANARIVDHWMKYPDWESLDLREWARRRLGLPLVIDNDARMALIGEWQCGAGRGCENLAIMTLGTGLGTAAMIGGKALRGVHGQAGILGGHLTVHYGGSPCICGNVGCAEAEASTWALQGQGPPGSVAPGCAGPGESALDYAAVFKRAAAGEARAIALRNHALTVWSATAVNMIHAYDPERLILGGGIMASADAILPVVRAHVERHGHTPWGRVSIVPSALGDHAALLACEWLVNEHRAGRLA